MCYPAFRKRVLGVSKAHNKKEKEIKVNYNMKKNLHYYLLNVRNYVIFQTSKQTWVSRLVELLAAQAENHCCKAISYILIKL